MRFPSFPLIFCSLGLLWSLPSLADPILPRSIPLTFSHIPLSQFRAFRDSDLSNAQNYCVAQFRQTIGREGIALWSVHAFDLAKDQTEASFRCEITYFDSNAALQSSPLWTLENLLDSLPFDPKGPDGAILMTEVNRLPHPPYIQISLKNQNPESSLDSLVPQTSSHSLKVLTTQDLPKVSLEDGRDGSFEFKLSPSQHLRVQLKPHPTLEISSSPPVSFKSTHSRLKFPAEFKWSIATSAYQIEGRNSKSDWSDFEKMPGRIFKNQKNTLGADHWNQLEKDISLLKEMGVRQYRMSIEWSRIEPEPGKWDEEATRHYRQEIELLQKNQIEPIITLWHSTLPHWVVQKEGWRWEGIPKAFETFARYTQEKIAPNVQTWVTLNEPLLYLVGAYVAGVVPPAEKGPFDQIGIPLTQMLRAHALVYHSFHALEKTNPELKAGEGTKNFFQIGIAHRLDAFTPYDPNSPLDRWMAKQAQQTYNWAIPQALQTGTLKISIPFISNLEIELPEIEGTQDYFGLNYYTRYSIHTSLFPLDIKTGAASTSQEVTDMGWDMYPEGLYLLLKEAHRRYPKLPIWITENGIADSLDRFRSRYLRRHLVYLYRAIQEGVPVRGYSYWSLYDNFEWDQGFSIRVGLFETDYKNRERKPRGSAHYYKEIIRNNGIVFQ